MSFASILKTVTFKGKKKDQENTGEMVHTKCNDCWWRNKADGTNCDAFPGGIPLEILTGIVEHTTPYSKDGFDDLGLTYEQEPK